jgi:hypothetical protein
VAALPQAAEPAKNAAPEEEVKRIQGTWDEDTSLGRRLEFRGDELIYRRGTMSTDPVKRGTYMLGPATGSISWEAREGGLYSGTYRGSYKIEGDRLTLEMAQDPFTPGSSFDKRRLCC